MLLHIYKNNRLTVSSHNIAYAEGKTPLTVRSKSREKYAVLRIIGRSFFIRSHLILIRIVISFSFVSRSTRATAATVAAAIEQTDTA